MNLQQALTQINDIHSQLARAQVFRGYRSLTTLSTGIVAAITGFLQHLYIRNPATTEDLSAYVILWMSAAVLNLLIVAGEMAYRLRRSQSRLQTELTLLAIEQFLPALFAGAMLTAVILFFAPQVGWLLPGLWLLVFALGVFASCRLLPKLTFWVAGFYLLASAAVLALSPQNPLSPWLMTIPFGIGQAAIAVILHVCLERNHV